MRALRSLRQMILGDLGSKHASQEEVAAGASVEVVGGMVGEVGDRVRCGRSRTVLQVVQELLLGKAAGNESDSEGVEQAVAAVVVVAHLAALVVGQAEGMEAVMEVTCYLGTEGCQSKHRPHSTSFLPAQGRRSFSCPSDPASESSSLCTKDFYQC